jgi:3-oxoacyl-[acyl-carrier-protein] synthase-3
LNNTKLAAKLDDWTAEKIRDKTGIAKRHIASKNETALDLAENAANKLFACGVCSPDKVEYILFCTQSPDYFLPTTACLLQERLGVSTAAGAADYNLGCSGFVYGLSLAKGLIETGQVKNVLLITSETYSKYIKDDNINVRTIFGDAAAATFIEGKESEYDLIGPFVFGTDGSGKDNLIVKNRGHRNPELSSSAELYMNGPDIFLFTIKTVPKAVKDLLGKCGDAINDINYFVFHQANQYMLEHLRNKIGISKSKFCIDMKDYGNTVSSSIPIALSNLMKKNVLHDDAKIMLVGFGVGYSWGATICRFIK